MVYRAVGLMSGSSLDGLDIVYAELEESGGNWTWSIPQAECLPYPADWFKRLSGATGLSALDYQLLHADYGHWLGAQVMRFMDVHGLQYKVALVASHGHTTFHIPGRMTGQLGDGSAIAAETGLPVVSDLRAMDVALGGQGAPIVPIGEKLLWPGFSHFLNIGGIANISRHGVGGFAAFDVCPANRVLNLLSAERGMAFDDGGRLAAAGRVDPMLLETLNGLDYYVQGYPKSLDNAFGTDTVLPMIRSSGLSVEDGLATFVAHISQQVRLAAIRLQGEAGGRTGNGQKMLVTGGGAFNTTLLSLITEHLAPMGIVVEAADTKTVNYKEGLVMALLGVLRWREEETVLTSVTGAIRASIGGALWMGTR
jgi:anhydro-N-acetylmuramic acid kinase